MHVFLFDIDGTLLSSGGAGKAALEAGFAEEFGFQAPIDQVRLSGRTDRAITTDVLHHAGLPTTPENRNRLLQGYLRHLPAALRHRPGGVLPGVVDLIARLQGRSDTTLGLLTGNVRVGARIKLGHFGLADHFAFGGYGDDHLHRDDVAREALAALQQHHQGIEPSSLWVIGDTPHDITCARAIGAHAVAVCTGWHSREELAACNPDLLLCDLAAWEV
ncbi:MAG: haloacid dehalogenase-like hydrolase [Gemmataceae bacterium]